VFASPRPSGFTPSTRGQGYEQIADNERFRAWRLALKPGESAAPYKQGAPGMRVIVSGGELTESVPGQPDRGMKPRDGQFFWQEAGTTRTVKNTGTTPLNIVEIELK
jgi:mannose-6-phosphate isomerase-like protein (cupin superfamily)